MPCPVCNRWIKGVDSPSTIQKPCFCDEDGDQSGILEAIKAERERQDHKWGEQNHSISYWFPIIIEELGEAAEAFLEGRVEDYKKEMIEAAACCIAAIECQNRKECREYIEKNITTKGRI